MEYKYFYNDAKLKRYLHHLVNEDFISELHQYQKKFVFELKNSKYIEEYYKLVYKARGII